MAVGSLEVILSVQDMARRVAFHRDLLGLKVTYSVDVQDYAGQPWVTFDTGACTLALHGGGRGRLGEDAPKIVFRVDDVHAARAQLLTRGVPLSEVRAAASGISVCDGVDLEGNPFSLESQETGG